jgi:hypothetical protein
VKSAAKMVENLAENLVVRSAVRSADNLADLMDSPSVDSWAANLVATLVECLADH